MKAQHWSTVALRHWWSFNATWTLAMESFSGSFDQVCFDFKDDLPTMRIRTVQLGVGTGAVTRSTRFRQE
jgi:hypothetical protein